MNLPPHRTAPAASVASIAPAAPAALAALTMAAAARAVAVMSFALDEISPAGQAGAASAASAPTRIKLLPAGEFAARDGRPGNLPDSGSAVWRLDDAQGAALAAALNAQAASVALVIDYEHQTLLSKENGQPAPAAGWMRHFEFIAGDGLYATGVEWTAKAAAMLAAQEYRYRSPVFAFDPVSGQVQALHSLALTNNPGLDVLPVLAALAQAAFLPASPKPASQPAAQPNSPSTVLPPKEFSLMNKVALCVALSMASESTDESVLAAVAALKTKAEAQAQEIAALKTTQFDAAQHIPLAEHQKITTELAALKAANDKAEHTALLTAALADGRILPANKDYWAAQTLPALQGFLKDAKPLADLSLQTAGAAPAAGSGGTAVVQLSADELAVCRSLGMSAAEFAAGKATA